MNRYQRHVKRAQVASWIIILTLGALSVAGIISPALSLALQGMVLAFALGAFYEASHNAESARKHAVTQTEEFLAWGHDLLTEDRIPDEQRETLEMALNAAQQTLHVMDACAPITVKLRRKMEARKA